MATETRKEGWVNLRAATAADLPAVLALLGGAGLPTEGVVAEALADFVIAEDTGKPVGVVGLEVYRESALLRSAAVEESWHYFPRFGFACVGRESVPQAVRASAEFQGACPSTAVVMRRTA